MSLGKIYWNPTFQQQLNTMLGCTPIAFDMDSVLNNMGDSLGDWLARYFDRPSMIDYSKGYRQFHFNSDDIASMDIFHAVVTYILEESVSLLPTPFMPNVMGWLYNKVLRRPILVITARPKNTMDVTYQWLVENMPVPFVCYMVPNHECKQGLMLNHGVQTFVDDRWATIKGLTKRIDQPILYQREWNQGREEKLGVIEIRDLRDIIPVVNINHGRVPMDWPAGVPFPKPTGERITKRYATII